MKNIFKKAVAFLLGATLMFAGSIFTTKTDKPFTFEANAIGYQGIKITSCNFSYQQGWYSYFDIQCIESNFGQHKGKNYSWMTHSWGIPQYKCDPYFNPYNVHPWVIYNVPKSFLQDDDWWIEGYITIR